ncbi:hypothetical protein Tco_0656985 [Tanacetum coccineum]|uniref:Uncharacterized protein n=1 Tax=Tanacetum coccineum TaxID=301880 RepID=A0ABQ4XAC5_9ASTR
MGWFSFIDDVAKYGRIIIDSWSSGDGKPSVSGTCRANTGTSNVEQNLVGVDVGLSGDMFGGVGLGWELTYGSSGKSKTSKVLNRDIGVHSCFSRFYSMMKDVFWIRPGGSAIGIHGLQRFVPYESLHRVNEVLYSFISKDEWVSSLDESLENEEHLDVDSCDSDSPKNVNNDSVSPSSRVLREEDVRGVESDLVDSLKGGEIRDVRFDNVGVLRTLNGKECGR